MRTIGKKAIWSFISNRTNVSRISDVGEVSKDRGNKVTSYLDLATKIAELQFRNPEFVFLFRGQDQDYRDDMKKTTLKARLFRSEPGSFSAPESSILVKRFEMLKTAEEHLVQKYKEGRFSGDKDVLRHRILRWAILQHYEVCPTPLLDVTHSLRIAASFASENAEKSAFIYVLGVPNLSGAVTASAEAGLQIIRLSSVCPPAALRPHIQEGYLLGEYPDIADYDQKDRYGNYEIDFRRRLLAKFYFSPKTFWKSDDFPRVAHDALYPPEDKDPLFALAMRVKKLTES